MTVTNPDAQAATLASAFTYIGAAPTISGVTPTSRPDGRRHRVTITGTNFVSGATVTFGGTAATASASSTAPRSPPPAPAHAAGASTSRHQPGRPGRDARQRLHRMSARRRRSRRHANVRADGRRHRADHHRHQLRHRRRPSPSAAPPLRGVSVVNSTTITATSPAHAAGAVSVTVTNPDGQSGHARQRLHLSSRRRRRSVASRRRPARRPAARRVTITGTNFVTGATRHLRRHRRDGRHRRQQHHDHRHHAGACRRRRRRDASPIPTARPRTLRQRVHLSGAPAPTSAASRRRRARRPAAPR